jgi:CubicO group peptidase (beta-lactamase class C family)
VTKVFTAIAIMQLYEEGNLDIDKPVTDYLPDFSIHQRFPESLPVTIRSILTHHSGLPGEYAKNKFSEEPDDFHILLQFLNGQSTCFPVDKVYSYSNLGYNLLGIVIEKVSGEKYEEYIKKHIFEIAEMKSAGFYKRYEAGKSYSNGFDVNGKFCRELPLIDIPAGGIYASLNDMLRLGQTMLKKESPLLKEQTKAIMLEIQNLNVDLDLHFRIAICLNISNKASELGRLYEHGGATMYHRADFAFSPDAGLGMVMLSNSGNGTLNSWKLKEVFMVDYVKKNNLKIEKNSIPDKTVSLTQHTDKKLKSFEGWYATYGMVCNFEIKHEYLKTEIQGNSFYLTPHGKDAYVPAKRILGYMAKSESMYFLMEEIDNEKLFIEAKPWGELVIIGQKFLPEPLSEKWKNAIGRYEEVDYDPNSQQMITNLELVDNDGLMILRFRYNEAFYNKSVEAALQPIDELTAYIVGLGRNGGEQVRLRIENDDNQIYLNFAGIKFQPVVSRK